MTLPYYYSRLRPFREVFRAGIPVLCFHHIKAPSHGARLKWMYVSPRIFARQMAELQYEGFLTSEPFGSHALFDTEGPVPAHLAQCSSQPGGFASSSEVTRSHTNPNRKVVLSFDDGFRDVFEHALPVLQHNRFCGITFLVSDLLGKSNEWQLRMGDVKEPLMDAVQVREWLAAGQGIGSHTKTHPHLTQLSLADAREEITASKKSLEDRFSVPIDHFCYPYGDWNEAVGDLVIEAGYKTASTVHPGVNTPETNPFELNRFTAQAGTWGFKALLQRLRARLARVNPVRIPPPGRLTGQPALR